MRQFIRGDLPTSEFESWLYKNSNFEDVAGEEFYLEVISTNFKNKPALYDLKQKLEEYMRQKLPLSCECMSVPNITLTNMGSPRESQIFSTLEEIKEYAKERWWLHLSQCKNCSQFWLVAQESRQYDIHYFKRLEKADAENIIQNNTWPKCFETLEELFVMGKHSNVFVEFVDPLDSSLIHSVEDLKKARPEISTAEIASLLNIDECVAIEISNNISKPHLQINLGGDFGE